jgi:hypothetical protein
MGKRAQYRESAATFRGAKIRAHTAATPIAAILQPQVKHYSAIGYELAMANRHKGWAKRWMRTHLPGRFW